MYQWYGAVAFELGKWVTRTSRFAPAARCIGKAETAARKWIKAKPCISSPAAWTKKDGVPHGTPSLLGASFRVKMEPLYGLD